MYSCGPTVYRYAHIGNLRTFLLADLIRRALLYHGLEVLQIQNITDVGHLREDAAGREVDPMLVAAGLDGRSSREIADAYEAAFHADAALLNLLPAHEYPRATEHVPEMLDLAEQLESLGHAYVSPAGNLYYDVSTYPAYGALSRNSLDDLRAGHRSDVEPDKRDPADFALWKVVEPGSDREMRWPSKWGEGFPGWHLECSAMALRHLGPRFDLHTGGIDNVFPHHEDEIAQSAPIVGGPPARIWAHGEFLNVGGKKMAKSAGNIERIADVAARGIDPLAFRLLCLTSRYRHKLEYTDESLAAAAAGLASLRMAAAALGPKPAEGPWAAPSPLRAGAAAPRPTGTVTGIAGNGDGSGPELGDRAHDPDAPLSAAGRAFHDRFAAALDDDLDLPTAYAVVREIVRSDLAVDERRWLVLDADFVLGLDLDRAAPRDADRPAVPAQVAELADARIAARSARDYATADALRSRIADAGFEVTELDHEWMRGPNLMRPWGYLYEGRATKPAS
jgi:cysteinyl-tRNA synthetase